VLGSVRRVDVRPLGYTGSMADDVRELMVTEAALVKLGARGIAAAEAEQVPRNQHATVRDPRPGAQGAGRRLLIGRTDGGRVLTLVVARAVDPTTWLIVTGWDATETERKILERR
jgi:uncharacterized DUF497 family protein